MTKRNKIIYWIATGWLALGMLSTGAVQVFKFQPESEYIARLGYPEYFLTILGSWKILGTIAILLPKFTLVKEWAYAGFFFMMSGALLSHIAAGSPVNDMFPSLLLLALTLISYFFRPAARKLAIA